jgi:hypothetical protein
MRFLCPLLLIALSTTAIGCSTHQDLTVPAATPLQTPQFTLDLISNANCQLLLGRLRKCAIAPRAFFPPSVEHAVPKRTVLTRVASLRHPLKSDRTQRERSRAGERCDRTIS